MLPVVLSTLDRGAVIDGNAPGIRIGGVPRTAALGVEPITDPAVGFTNWHDYVENMFCEVDNLQVLCLACHKIKCQEETDIATARKRMEKEYVG